MSDAKAKIEKRRELLARFAKKHPKCVYSDLNGAVFSADPVPGRHSFKIGGEIFFVHNDRVALKGFKLTSVYTVLAQEHDLTREFSRGLLDRYREKVDSSELP
jgi:hypothetical protein